jgi:tight adherence protein B
MSDTWLKALVLASIFGAVLLAVEVLVGWLAAHRVEGKAIGQRLKSISQSRQGPAGQGILRRQDGLLGAGMSPYFSRLAGKFERMLIAARVTVPPARMALAILLAPVALFFLLLLVMTALGSPIGGGRLLMVGTFAAVTGGLLPLMLLNMRATRTRKRMQEQFPVALDVFVRGLRAGHPIAAALDLLRVEMPDPIGTEFGLVVEEVTYGAELRDALQAMADRWDLEDMRMFIVSLSVQSETGGNLAEILDNLSKVIRERASMMMKVRALSSEGRMTAIMLTALPVIAFTMLFIMNPKFYLDVADDPAFVPGFVGLIVLYAVGFFTIRRMVDLKV